MTKICGLLSGTPDIRVPELLERMYEATWQSCYRQREVWSDGPVGLGHFNIGAVNTEKQPLIDPTSGVVAVSCGKIFDYEHDRKKLEKKGVTFRYPANDSEFLLHFVRNNDPIALKAINGIFSLAVWDPTHRKLVLTGDRYGFRPLYYYHDASRGILAFGSDLRAILATGLPKLQVNWRAVNAFLQFGHALENDTLFEGIFRLPPACVLTFENNKVELKTYWRLGELPVREGMTLDEAVDGCVDLFQQAIQRRLKASPARHMVLLSGGQDSRHIAAELSRQQVELTAYTTTGFKPAVHDQVIAKQVAQALKIPHVYVPLPKKDFLTDYWPRAHALVDYETNLHEWILPLVDSLPCEPHINFDGIVGDTCLSSVYMNSHNYRLSREDRLDELTSRFVERDHHLSIFHPSIAGNLDNYGLYESVRAQFQEFSGHPNLISFAILKMRTRRAISLFAFKLVSEKAESFYPFADNDYFDFAMSIPPEHKLDGMMHRRVLDRAFPELREIPTTKEINKQEYVFNEINYYGQKRRQLQDGLWKMIAGRSWVFNRRTALPRLLRDLPLSCIRSDRRFFLCNPAVVVLAEWFERYFPNGVE